MSCLVFLVRLSTMQISEFVVGSHFPHRHWRFVKSGKRWHVEAAVVCWRAHDDGELQSCVVKERLLVLQELECGERRLKHGSRRRSAVHIFTVAQLRTKKTVTPSLSDVGSQVKGRGTQTAVPHTGLLPQRGKRCPELRHWREPTTPNSINTDCGNWGEEAQGTTREGGPGKTNLWVGYNSAGTLPDTLRPRRPSEESKGASEADVCKPRRSRRSTR